MEDSKVKELKKRFENLNVQVKKQNKKSVSQWEKIMKDLDEAVQNYQNSSDLEALAGEIHSIQSSFE